jgi:hypothetical protein
VVRALYRGPTYRGRQLYDGGQPYGSELAWDGWVTQPADDLGWPADTSAYGLSFGYHKHLAYWRNPPASFSLRDLRFTPALYRRLRPLAGLYDSTDPKLRAFRAHGGKIILYHGWADQGLPPWATTNYYAAVARRMGGYQAIQSFSRLYMIPGLYHCPSPCGHVPTGDPAINVDLIDELIRWVEQGPPPQQVSFPVSEQTTGTPLTSLAVRPLQPAGSGTTQRRSEQWLPVPVPPRRLPAWQGAVVPPGRSRAPLLSTRPMRPPGGRNARCGPRLTAISPIGLGAFRGA